MKNKIYKLLFLGISTAIIAGVGYGITSTNQTESVMDAIALTLPAIQSQSTAVTINMPVTVEKTTIKPIPLSFTHNIKSGESLSTIFSKFNLSKGDLHQIIHANNVGKQFASILPGKKLFVDKDSNGRLQQLVYKKNSFSTLKATRIGHNFKVELISKPIEKRITSVQATINSSLFLDGKKAGLSDKLMIQLANMFAWDIDFALNLRKGDQFTVVYEKLFVENKAIGLGHILSAEFINQSHTFTSVRFEDKKGKAKYYTPEGVGMRKAFLRTPVDFTRISSHFNLTRKHPVLNKIRAHKGVDYVAKTGTSVKTTGHGKIIYRGRKGGYGRVVIVQHEEKYSTLYAHLSSYKKGQKVGSQVNQGTVIGYVGQSGLATGPHLHYEFRVNGVHKNPLTIKLPRSRLPIKKSLLAEFKRQIEPYMTQLNKVKARTLLAQN